MINENSQVIHTGPRISAALFSSVLESSSSPALPEAAESYAVIVAEQVDPLFLLAVFHQESALGTVGIAVSTKSPGNTRSSRTGVETTKQTAKGEFVTYPTWTAGFRDLAKRLTDPSYVYVKEGRQTIEQIISRLSPAEDGNNPVKYISAAVDFMNRFEESKEFNKMLRVALAAGHHNSDGGSALEASITGELCEAYFRAFKAAGVDVRVITPDGNDADSDPGDGMFPGGLDAVAQQVVNWSAAGWTADLFLECHTQGLGDTSVRGVFSIYPDWGGDLDSTVKNQLGQRIAQAVSAASGIPVWGNGLMSEKSTGVGISGYRLGIFRVTAAVAAKTTRLIVEHGAHTNRQDLAILQTPGMLDRIARAAVKTITEFYGVTKNVEPQIIAMPTGKVLGGGFKAKYDRLAKVEPNFELTVLGYPITNEYDCALGDKTRTVQLFERGGLVFAPENAAPFDVHLLTWQDLATAVLAAKSGGLI